MDPTFFGWAICLACYPPFNDFTSRFLEWQSSDFPHFENTAVHFAANISLLTALSIYSWASVALGFKASNLTNRGIVSHGPYAFVRHPAYAAKNLAWWIGALPDLYLVFASGNVRNAAYALLALCGWTTIYALRAITEERHLLLVEQRLRGVHEPREVALHPGRDLNTRSFALGNAAQFFELGGIFSVLVVAQQRELLVVVQVLADFPQIAVARFARARGSLP